MVCPAGQHPLRSPALLRAEVVERLQARRVEIEEAILTRAFAVSKPTGAEGADYLHGLKAAVTAAVDYGLEGIEHGAERLGPPPSPVLAQARNAARNRVGLEIVLRRYAAGYSALGDFLQQEARHRRLRHLPDALYSLQRELTALFDRLVAAVSAEYQREAARVASPSAQRLTERIRRLLAGELVNLAELDYDFDAWHLGAIALGEDAEQVLRDLAATLDRRLLLAESGEHTTWAWLGGRHRADLTRLPDLPAAGGSPTTLLALGEPAEGLRGWRLTHRQAAAALSVALRFPRHLTRYADVALIASALGDDDLAHFLTDTYLAPLAKERDGAQTLRAFFAAGRNASSAAAALGVARQTITSRLRAIEERIGRPLDQCGAEVELSLRLADLNSSDDRMHY
jgi:hypothetical protein